MKKTIYACLLIALVPTFGQAQTRTIQGRATDERTGDPLSGVSVAANTASGRTLAITTTDGNGTYSIQVAAEAIALVFRYVGKTTLREEIGGRNAIDVRMAEDPGQLDAVIVTGYTTTTKATLSGSVSTISGGDMARTKNENTLNMLTGKVPGLRVVQQNSAPGAYSTVIDIRGMGAPLFVIDGVPREGDYFSRMNAEEIESVSVLKDGTAAVYGLRAANGVILVTTKRGTNLNGKTDIAFGGSATMQTFLYVPQSVGAIDYMTLRNERKWQDLGSNYLVRQSPDFTEADFQPYRDGTKQSYNWMDRVFRKVTPQYDGTLSVDGGSDKLRYYFNLGYLLQGGSLRSGDYESSRWSFGSNIDAKLTERLKAQFSLAGFMVNTDQALGADWSMYKNTWLMRPDASFYANDNPEYLNGDSAFLYDGNNMIARTDAGMSGYAWVNDRRFNGKISLEYAIPGVQGLSAKGLYDYATRLPDNKAYRRSYLLYVHNPGNGTYTSVEQNTPSVVDRGVSFRFDTNMQLGLFYNNSFGRHNFNNFLLYEEGYGAWDGFGARREVLVDSDHLFAGEAANQLAQGYGVGDRSNKSLVGQLDYNYAAKYMAAFRFRYDGSSRFPKGSRFGFFPSASAAWRISEESFLKDNPFASELKLRASYGEMGDDSSAANYPPATGYVLQGGEFGWFYNGSLLGGVAASAIPNPNLTWYRVKSYNLGMDFGFLRNKLTVALDVYKRDRSGLLATSAVTIPGTVGAALPQENLNSDRNFGYEIEVGWRNTARGFSYYAKGQLSGTKHMYRDWIQGEPGNSFAQWRNGIAGRYSGIWWGLESGGMFTDINQARTFEQYVVGQGVLPGDWWLQDWNEDGIIDGWDQHPIGTIGIPLYNYGISLGAAWKGFNVALDFQGTQGVYMQYSEVLTESLPFGGQNTLSWFMDRWRPADPNADYFHPDTEWIPGHYPVTGRNGRASGTNGVQDGSYMRLKTAQIGYTLPNRLLGRTAIKDLRFYLSGYNLLTFTGLKNVDPERPGYTPGAFDFYTYPVNRTFTVGASVRF